MILRVDRDFTVANSILGLFETQVKKNFRLTRSTDFKRVRQFGKSYAHPLIVLYTTVSGEPQSRVGVSAGRWVGGAVDRNRAKRLLREAVRSLYSQIEPGYDLLLIARVPLPAADLSATKDALQAVMQRAKLIKKNYDDLPLST